MTPSRSPLCDPDELIPLMQAGDIAALDRLTRCYGDRLLEVGRRRCADEASAQDAVQDALLGAGLHLTDFRGDGSVEGWLVRMVANACSRMRRGRKNDPKLHTTTLPERLISLDDPENEVLRRQLAAAMGDAMLALSPRDRALLILAEAEGHTGPELARRLDMTPAAVRTRLSRARKRMRESLGPLWQELAG